MEDNKLINSISKLKDPISIEEFINLCLYSNHGYYSNKIVIGKKGDFTTSPEISQLFGEILGLFIFSEWKKNINKDFNLIELGPGNATLLIDILNVTKNNKDFNKAINLKLIEKNKELINQQKINLVKFNHDVRKIKWQNDFKINKDKPVIVFSNEFFDCLPIRQFYKKNEIFYEKMLLYNNINQYLSYVDLEVDNKKIISKIKNYDFKDVLEVSTSREEYFNKICEHIKIVGGLCIIVDYGYYNRPNYFTLQSVHNNKVANVLDNPGKQDITSLVDFKSFLDIAKKNQLETKIFCSQRDFFLNLGIKERAKKIINIATKNQKTVIKKGLEILINNKKMGSLFKVLVISKNI